VVTSLVRPGVPSSSSGRGEREGEEKEGGGGGGGGGASEEGPFAVEPRELLYTEEGSAGGLSWPAADGDDKAAMAAPEAGGWGQRKGDEGRRPRRPPPPRRPPAFGVAPAFPMVGRSDGLASSAGASWPQLPPDGILRHARWRVAASAAAATPVSPREAWPRWEARRIVKLVLEAREEELGEAAERGGASRWRGWDAWGAGWDGPRAFDEASRAAPGRADLEAFGAWWGAWGGEWWLERGGRERFLDWWHGDGDEGGGGDRDRGGGGGGRSGRELWREFARELNAEAAEAVEAGAASDPAPSVCLVCSDSPATRALWPHAFSATYTISLMQSDDFADEDEEARAERKKERAEERRAVAAAERRAAREAAATAAAAEGGGGGGEASGGGGGEAKLPIARAGKAAAGKAGAAAAADDEEDGDDDDDDTEEEDDDDDYDDDDGGEERLLPYDFPELTPENDPDGKLAKLRRAPPPGPKAPVQLRMVLEVENPLPSLEGEDGERGGGERERARGEGPGDLVFAAAVCASVALRHPTLPEVRGAAGRVTLDSSGGGRGGGGGSQGAGGFFFPRAPELGVAPEEPLSLAGTRHVDVVWVGSGPPSPSGSSSSTPAAAASSSAPRPRAPPPLQRGRGRLSDKAPRPYRLSPGSVVLDTGAWDLELELIPRAGFRDTGVRAPAPRARRRVPGLAAAQSAVDAAYAADLAAGSAFVSYPHPGGEYGLGDPTGAHAAEAASAFSNADADNSGGARTLLARRVAVGLVGEMVRPVRLEPGETFRGEAVLRVHDLSHDRRWFEGEHRRRRGVASRPAFGDAGGVEVYERGDESMTDLDVTGIDDTA
jgi:hypothetical protein